MFEHQQLAEHCTNSSNTVLELSNTHTQIIEHRWSIGHRADYRTLCWIIEHRAGLSNTALSNTVLDYRTLCWITNTVLDCRTPCWINKHRAGLSNTVPDYRTLCWIIEHSLDYQTLCWIIEHCANIIEHYAG
jgi:hypothetical protein